MEMELLENIIAAIGAGGAGKSAVRVTVVDVKGSAPRHPGSSMLVLPSGGIVGTVGGGHGEAVAIKTALAAFESRRSSFIEVEMLGEEATGPELICGGVNRMLVEYLADLATYTAARHLLLSGKRVLFLRRLERGEGGRVELSTVVLGEDELAQAPDPARAAAVLNKGAAFYAETEGLFYEPILPTEKLLIMGGGHVGLALAKAASAAGFAVTVVDDRPEFADENRFGHDVKTILAPYTEAIIGFPFDRSAYAVILTRGHLFDLECCQAVLKREYRYAGLIGSKRKTSLILEELRKEGYDEKALASMHTPIGISIGAETPEEIAISILAQMIAVRRGVA